MKLTFKKFLEQKNISEADYANKSAEETAKIHSEYIEEVAKELAKNSATKADIDAITKQLSELPIDKLKGDISEAMESIQQILEKTTPGKMGNTEKYMLRKMVQDNHEEIIDAIKNKKPFEFTFKAAEMHMTNNGTVTNAVGLTFPITDNVMVDNDIVTIRRPENFILNVIPNRQVDKVPAQRIRKEQAPTEGAVAVTAEGAVKPLLQYKFVRTTTDRDKYAGRIEWTEEFEIDFELLFGEILKMFEADVIRAWQEGLIAQIIDNATAYVSSTLDNTLIAPDNGLAVVATQSQLNGLNFIADTVIMNPADVVATMFQQDANGNLKLSPYIDVKTGTINGMKLISTNTIEQGTALIGDSKVYDEIHSDFIFRVGQYNAQFIENEYTAIGEIFSILRIAQLDLNAWVEIDLDVVKAALLKPATP